jgi:hypothetical protein
MKGNLNYETYRYTSKPQQTPSPVLSTDGNMISLSENKKVDILKNNEDEKVTQNLSIKHVRATSMEINRNRISNNVSKKPIRPSLSEQLAMITAQAETLTTDIRTMGRIRNMKDDLSAHNEFQLLFTMPAKYFEIGTLTCRYPSPIFFYVDRCEYSFSHPYESTSIKMIMHYKDMISATVTNLSFKFKLPKKLAHFSADFDPTNPTHSIKIELATKINSETIKNKIIPLITAGHY